MRDISSIIERMRQVTGVRTDAELSKYLGFKSNSAISTWKAREKIPYAECDVISQNENIDLGWLLTGVQEGKSIFPNPLHGEISKDYSIGNGNGNNINITIGTNEAPNHAKKVNNAEDDMLESYRTLKQPQQDYIFHKIKTMAYENQIDNLAK